MQRWILGAAILISLVSTGVAWADDDAWAEDRVVRVKSEKSSEEEPREVRAAGAHRRSDSSAEEGTSLSSDTAGSYFGLGDEFRMVGRDESGNATFTSHEEHNNDRDSAPEPEVARSSRSRNVEAEHSPAGHSPADHRHNSDGYSNENVYGPMWGVPEDAVGLDGFGGNPYPGMVDGDNPEEVSSGRHNHNRNNDAESDDDGGSSDENVQRNHKINRSDPNEW